MLVELPYSLHSRYVSIAIAWTVITIPPIFINLGLFYGLWFGQPQLDRILGLLSSFANSRAAQQAKHVTANIAQSSQSLQPF
jgi:hypothetical protein